MILWLVRLNSITSDPNGDSLQKFMIIKYIYSLCICELAHDGDVSQSERMTACECLRCNYMPKQTSMH